MAIRSNTSRPGSHSPLRRDEVRYIQGKVSDDPEFLCGIERIVATSPWGEVIYDRQEVQRKIAPVLGRARRLLQDLTNRPEIIVRVATRRAFVEALEEFIQRLSAEFDSTENLLPRAHADKVWGLGVATNVAELFSNYGLKPTTTQEGRFWQTVQIVFDAIRRGYADRMHDSSSAGSPVRLPRSIGPIVREAVKQHKSRELLTQG